MGQIKIPPTPASLDLSGKTVIVTGANTGLGLGLESARQYLILHAARVILAVRTSPKAKKPRDLVVELDLDDYQSVFRFTESVKQKLGVLDVVLLNGRVNIMN